MLSSQTHKQHMLPIAGCCFKVKSYKRNNIKILSKKISLLFHDFICIFYCLISGKFHTKRTLSLQRTFKRSSCYKRLTFSTSNYILKTLQNFNIFFKWLVTFFGYKTKKKKTIYIIPTVYVKNKCIYLHI